MQDRDKLYIGGEWVAPARPAPSTSSTPATEEVIGTVPVGTAADVDRAVRRRRAAFEQWSRTPPSERAGYTTADRRGSRRAHGRDRASRSPAKSACRSTSRC